MPAEVRTRRWDDPRRPGDGLRVLVCRYRPRALPAAEETWDVWWKDLAPSIALHAAVYGKGQTPIGWDEYRRRFLGEMAAEPGRSRLRAPAERVHGGELVTLLCSSACIDETRCHRTLLRELLVAGEPVTRLDAAAARTRDLRADPRLDLEIGGRTFAGIARLLEDGEGMVARRLVEQKRRQADGAPWDAAAVPVAITLIAVRRFRRPAPVALAAPPPAPAVAPP